MTTRALFTFSALVLLLLARPLGAAAQDADDTTIRYPARDNPSSFTTAPPPRLPSELRHNLQVTAGIGFSF